MKVDEFASAEKSESKGSEVILGRKEKTKLSSSWEKEEMDILRSRKTNADSENYHHKAMTKVLSPVSLFQGYLIHSPHICVSISAATSPGAASAAQLLPLERLLLH